LSARNVLLKWQDVAAAFLMACLAWPALMWVWAYAAPGGLVDTLIRTLFAVPYVAGRHLAHVVFPDAAAPNAYAYRFGPLLGTIGEILALMVLWLVGAGGTRWWRARCRTVAGHC